MKLTFSQLEIFERLYPALELLLPEQRKDRLAELARGGMDIALIDSLRLALEMPQSIRQLPIGTPCGDCELLDVIGQGGCGIVYRARQTVLSVEVTVAVKLIQPEYLCDPDHREDVITRFRSEAGQLASLRHPGIVQVRRADVLMLPGTGLRVPYIVMDFVTGTHLDDACRGLRLGDKIGLHVKLCEAVQFAHRNKQVHLDLKPANILVPPETSQPVVLDFGLARVIEVTAPLYGTAHFYEGTLPYMSPEQLDSTVGPIGVRSDVHALGVILFQILTDSLPYHLDAGTREDFKRAIVSPHRVRLTERDSTLPGELGRIVARAMAHDPKERYDSPASLARDLAAFVKSSPLDVQDHKLTASAEPARIESLKIGMSGGIIDFEGIPAGAPLDINQVVQMAIERVLPDSPPADSQEETRPDAKVRQKMARPSSFREVSNEILPSLGLLFERTTQCRRPFGCAWRYKERAILCSPEVGRRISAALKRRSQIELQWQASLIGGATRSGHTVPVVCASTNGGTLWWLTIHFGQFFPSPLNFSNEWPGDDENHFCAAAIEDTVPGQWRLCGRDIHISKWEELGGVSTHPALTGNNIRLCEGAPIWNGFGVVMGHLASVDTGQLQARRWSPVF